MEISKITEELIYYRIVHLKSNKRIVLPHIFFTDELEFDLNAIYSWVGQLTPTDRDRYICYIDEEVLGTLFAFYPHNAEDVQLEQVIMITEGGVKSLIKYTLLKKRKINKEDIYQLIQKITNAFNKAQQKQWKNNIFDDRKYEDKQYIPISTQTTERDKNRENDIADTQNKRFEINWKKIIGYTIAGAFLGFFIYLFCKEYGEKQDFIAVLTSDHWVKWMNPFVSLVSTIITSLLK